MLYIISGASRAGKTKLAKMLASDLGLPYLSTDWIMMGFNDGIPEFGVNHLMFPDEIAKKLWPFLKAMMQSMMEAQTDAIIEGEALLPELLAPFLKERTDAVRACFLGFIPIDPKQKVFEIKTHSPTQGDWLTEKEDAYILDHVKNMITHSAMIKAGCLAHHIAYFDTSHDFLDSLTKAKGYLTA
ncbi:hypothetical protein ABV409_09725 [Flagellimonas sp. DF-77]|uniref:hypothetical protein n=1 Tax=Flagellimonas algarum TaxID=3230298 RepID=UPI003393C32D